MNILFITLFITTVISETCVSDKFGKIAESCCANKTNCIFDYTSMTSKYPQIHITRSASEYYLPENSELIFESNTLTIETLTTKNVTLSGQKVKINNLEVVNITINCELEVDQFTALGENLAAGLGSSMGSMAAALGGSINMNIVGSNTVIVNRPLKVTKLSSSINTNFTLNNVITFKNTIPQIFVGTLQMNVLPALEFEGKKVTIVSNLNVTNSLVNEMTNELKMNANNTNVNNTKNGEEIGCMKICKNCTTNNVVFERSLTPFYSIMTKGVSVCSVAGFGCQYNATSKGLDDFKISLEGVLNNPMASMFNQAFKCDVGKNTSLIEHEINLVSFQQANITVDNNKGKNGSFVVTQPMTFTGDFEVRNLVINANTTLKGNVKAENVANTNHTLIVNSLVADQIIAVDLIVEKYLKANTLVATNLYVKKNAVIEVPSGMLFLNGTTLIEENVMMNLTTHKLYAARGAVSKVQAPVIYIDGNFSVTYPNIPMIVGNELLLFGTGLNVTIIHTNEAMFNNSYYDGIYLYRGTAVPVILSGQYSVKMYSSYPPKNWTKSFNLIPNTGMCEEKGGNYVAFLYKMFSASDKSDICQPKPVVKNDDGLWYIAVIIVGVMLLITIVVFAFFISKYKKDKLKEVILV